MKKVLFLLVASLMSSACLYVNASAQTVREREQTWSVVKATERHVAKHRLGFLEELTVETWAEEQGFSIQYVEKMFSGYYAIVTTTGQIIYYFDVKFSFPVKGPEKELNRESREPFDFTYHFHRIRRALAVALDDKRFVDLRDVLELYPLSQIEDVKLVSSETYLPGKRVVLSFELTGGRHEEQVFDWIPPHEEHIDMFRSWVPVYKKYYSELRYVGPARRSSH